MQHDGEVMVGRDEDYQARAARLTSYWDMLLSGSPYATRCFRSAFRYPGEIVELGYPRNDLFSRPDAAERGGRPQAVGLPATRGRSCCTRRPSAMTPTGANWSHQLELDIERLAGSWATSTCCWCDSTSWFGSRCRAGSLARIS